jgi:hypothetical protein
MEREEKKKLYKIYEEMFSWCSVYEPLIISEYFDRKNKFLSKYGIKTKERRDAEYKLIYKIAEYNAGCDTFRYMIKLFDKE